jgi:Fe-S-cluster containining protein
MPLNDFDIRRIRGLGFKNFFKVNKNGIRQLRNYNGKCIFHNGTICKIYNSRPIGCRLYPAVFDELKNNVILDNYCPFKEDFRLTSTISQKVMKLLNELNENKKIMCLPDKT